MSSKSTHTVMLELVPEEGIVAALRCDGHPPCSLAERFAEDPTGALEGYRGDPCHWEVPVLFPHPDEQTAFDRSPEASPVSGDATLDEWVSRIRTANTRNGWCFGRPRSDNEAITLLALITTEVVEAIEQVRAGRAVYENYCSPGKRPEGVPYELADVVIRALDLAGRWGIDIAAVMAEKMEYNDGRGFKRGGRFRD